MKDIKAIENVQRCIIKKFLLQIRLTHTHTHKKEKMKTKILVMENERKNRSEEEREGQGRAEEETMVMSVCSSYRSLSPPLFTCTTDKEAQW